MRRSLPALGIVLCTALAADAQAQAVAAGTPTPAPATAASESVLDGYLRLLNQKKLAGPKLRAAKS